MATQSRAPVILLTRPAAQSERFAQDLRRRVADCPIIVSPLLVPVFVEPVIPSRDWAAVIFTSETAVESVQRNAAYAELLSIRAFCVGDRTAKVAEAAGFRVHSANGTSRELAALIVSEVIAGPLLYLHGRETRGGLGEALNSAGLETVSLVCYAQEECGLSDEAIAALKGEGAVIAPVFSPRTGEILRRQVEQIGGSRSLSVVAISAAVEGFAGVEVIVAAQPTAFDVMNAVESKLRSLAEP